MVAFIYGILSSLLVDFTGNRKEDFIRFTFKNIILCLCLVNLYLYYFNLYN